MLALLSVFLASLGTVHTSKILLLPLPQDNSPIFLFRTIYDELQSRGHDAYFFIPGGDVPKLTGKDGGSNIKHITYQTKPVDLEGIARKNYSPAKITELAVAAWIAECDGLLSNTSNIAPLKADKPDVIMGFPFFPCTAMLAVELCVPYISVNPAGLPGNTFASPLWSGSGRDSGIAPHIATVPEMYVDIIGPPMTFWQRMRNAWAYVEAQVNDYLTIRPQLLDLQRKHGIDLRTPEVRRLELLHVISGDMALEVPRPLPPNVKLVGPIMAKPAKPLPADLEDFMEGAGEAGVALISLGTMAQFGREDILTIATALARLQARIIWKLTKQEVASAGGLEALNLTDNVKVVNWVPQNDVLGHPLTKAFLSHCGANGMYEAAYHGVPVVAMPFYGDQPLNARKLISKGTAVMLPRQGLTAEGVYDAFTRVLTDDSYRTAAAKVSKRIRSRKRTPLQEAADWVEHVLDSDGEPYLQLPDQHMNFFVRNSLDVIAAHLGAAIISLLAAVGIFWRVVGSAYRRMQWLAESKHKVV